MVNNFIEFLQGIIKEDPESANYLNDQLLNYYNSRKAYKGMLDGLRDPVLMQRKKAFENDLRSKVKSDEELNKKYGTIWTDIQNVVGEMKELSAKQSALAYDNYDSPEYFMIASQLIQSQKI